MAFCIDTVHGTVHRFPEPDSPCWCGAVVKNRRQHERAVVATPKADYGSRTGLILALIAARGRMTVSEMADASKKPKYWVRSYALRVLMRAGKLVKVGESKELDPRGRLRTVDIYGLPGQGAYPEDLHASN